MSARINIIKLTDLEISMLCLFLSRNSIVEQTLSTFLQKKRRRYLTAFLSGKSKLEQLNAIKNPL